jgi:hypothetical protein
MSEVTGIEDVADKIVFGVNIGYGLFLTMFSAYGLLIDIIAIIGVALGLVLVLISWMFLKPVKKEGWLYALIVNMVTIPVAFILLPDPL